MKIAFVYFSYSEDAPLLSIATRLAKLRGDNVTTFVAVDDNDPIDHPVPGDMYLYTTTPRGGNLRNWEWVYEEINVLLYIANKGYDWVVKVDSDTAFLREPLPDHTKYDVFYARKDNAIIFGPVIGFTKHGLEDLVDYMAERETTRKEGDNDADDAVITGWIDTQRVDSIQIGTEDVDFIHGFKTNYSVDDWLNASAIEFNETTWNHGKNPAYKKKAVIRMKSFEEALTSAKASDTVQPLPHR